MNPMDVIKAVMLYWYNTNPMDICNAVYPTAAPCYKEEKARGYRAGLTAFYGTLDYEHQERFVDAAIAKYGEEAARSNNINRGV